MKMHESYVIVYGFLTDYVDITGNLDVDSIASQMTPMVYALANGEVVESSFDPAVYEDDWVGAWVKIVGKDADASPKQVFEAAKEILSHYENELGYDLDAAEEFIHERLGVRPLTGRKDWAIQLIA